MSVCRPNCLDSCVRLSIVPVDDKHFTLFDPVLTVDVAESDVRGGELIIDGRKFVRDRVIRHAADGIELQRGRSGSPPARKFEMPSSGSCSNLRMLSLVQLVVEQLRH